MDKLRFLLSVHISIDIVRPHSSTIASILWQSPDGASTRCCCDSAGVYLGRGREGGRGFTFS